MVLALGVASDLDINDLRLRMEALRAEISAMIASGRRLVDIEVLELNKQLDRLVVEYYSQRKRGGQGTERE